MKKILVVGSLNMDMVLSVDHHPVPGETIIGDRLSYHSGGKGANQAYAVGKLGGDVRIKTVDGDVIYTVKPGTKTDTKVRLKGKGVPSLRNKQVRGDHYVTLVIQTPEKLSPEAKEALKKFDELSGNTLNQEIKTEEDKPAHKKKRGFMEKMKEAFDE